MKITGTNTVSSQSDSEKLNIYEVSASAKKLEAEAPKRILKRIHLSKSDFLFISEVLTRELVETPALFFGVPITSGAFGKHGIELERGEFILEWFMKPE